MNAHPSSPRRYGRRNLAIGLVCGAALACGGADAAAPFVVAAIPPFAVDTGPVPGGRLAFTYQPTGATARVYSVRTDGTELTALSPEGQWADAPTWSPDGSRVAYHHSDIGVAEIWVVRADGSGAMRIATDGLSPFWLDDASVGFVCPAGVCAAGADGSAARTLLAREQSEGRFDDSFRLSPDGTTLAFVRHTNAGTEIEYRALYLVKLDGTLERRITPDVFSDAASPSWSPDGTRIAYRRGLDVVVTDADGLHRRDVVLPTGQPDEEFVSSGPAWSPFGAQIVLGVDAREFYIAAADGSGPFRRVRVPMPSTDREWPFDAWSWTAR